MKIMNKIKRKTGSIALISLLIISGFTLIMVLALSESSISSYKQQSNNDANQVSFYAAEACLEEAITRIESGTGFTSETVEFDSNLRCTIDVSLEEEEEDTGITGEVIFAGEDLTINGSNIDITGGHANDDIKINGSNITAINTVTYVGDENINGSNIDVTVNQTTQQQDPSLPTSISTYYSMASSAGTLYYNSVSLSSDGDNIKVNWQETIPDGSIIYVNGGDIQINDAGFNKTVTLIAIDGKVQINGNNITLTPAHDHLAIYTQGDKVEINGTSMSVEGIIKTNDEIKINGNNGTLLSVYLWGESVILNGNGLQVQGYEEGSGGGGEENTEELGVHTISIKVEYLDYEQNYEGTINITSNGEARNAELTSWQEV